MIIFSKVLFEKIEIILKVKIIASNSSYDPSSAALNRIFLHTLNIHAVSPCALASCNQ